MFFWNSLASLMIQWLLAIWSLVPLAFLNLFFNIWKFTVHVQLKPGSENFEHSFTIMWVQLCGSLNILWHCLSLGLEWKLTFSSPDHCWVFQICWHIECSTLTASSFRVWNNSAGIPLPLALFLVMLPKTHLTLHSRMSGARWVIIPSWLSG